MRFSDIRGHGHIKDLLIKTVKRDRVPHSYLFHGPEGVGKYAMAKAFLSYLLCNDRQDDDSCGMCRSCVKIDSDRQADLVVLRPDKGTIKIDTIREAMPRLNFTPIDGPLKAVFIDSAHTMTIEASNALLKTLEEPPSKTLFILITSNIDILPRTIASRCFAVSFGPVPTPEIVEMIMERGKTSFDNARTAAGLSMGRPGIALSLANDEILSERLEFISSFLNLADMDPQQRLEFVDGIVKEKDSTGGPLSILPTLLSDILLASAGMPDSALANSDIAHAIRDFADKIGMDRARAMTEAFLAFDATWRYNPSLKTALDQIVLTL